MNFKKLNLRGVALYKKTKADKILRAGLILLIFIFMGRHLVKNYNEISSYKWHINYFLLGLSVLLIITISFSMAGVWQLIIRKYAPSLSRRNYMIIWLRSLLAKYLPGGIWNLVGRAYLCKKANINGVASLASIVLETLLFLLSQVIIISVLGSIYLTNLIDWSSLPFGITWVVPILFIFLAVAAIIIIIHPKIFSRILGFAMRSQGETFEAPQVKFRYLLFWLSLYVLINIGGGAAFYTFIISIYMLPLSLLPVIVVIVNITFFIGFLAPLAPNGLGIREGLLALLLSYFMPSSIAIAISLAARIWSTLSEIVSVGLGNLIFRVK